MKYLVKGDDYPDLFVLSGEVAADSLIVKLNGKDIFNTTPSELPVKFGLNSEQTYELLPVNELTVEKLSSEGKRTYIQRGLIYAKEGPLLDCASSLEEDSININLENVGYCVEVILTTSKNPKLVSTDNSVMLTETREGYDLSVAEENPVFTGIVINEQVFPVVEGLVQIPIEETEVLNSSGEPVKIKTISI